MLYCSKFDKNKPYGYYLQEFEISKLIITQSLRGHTDFRDFYLPVGFNGI